MSKKRFTMGIMMMLLLMLVMTGCGSNESTDTTAPQTEIATDEFGAAIDFDTVYIDELPTEIALEVNALIVDRGYHVWQSEGEQIVMISSGEKPTGGYGIEVVSLADYDGEYKILVGEGKPGKDAVVPQVITYPYVIIKFVGDLEVTEVVNEMTEEFALLESKPIELFSADGIYQGQIDNNSIEVKVGDQYLVLRSFDFETLLVGIETGDEVVVEYTTNSDGQNELVTFKKK